MSRTYRGISADERVAARREKLLDAGLELFGTRGFEATGVRDICRAAGVTDRYFYESFKDRTALLTAVFDRVTDDLFRAVAEAVVAVAREPEPQLRAAIGTFLGALADDPRRARIVFGDAGAAGGEVEQHMRRTLRRFADLVAATARPHLPHADDELVQVLALSLVGTLDRVIIEREDGRLAMAVDAVVDRCTELYLAFIRGAGSA